MDAGCVGALIPIRFQDEPNSLVLWTAEFVAHSLQIASDMRLVRASPPVQNPACLSLILKARWNKLFHQKWSLGVRSGPVKPSNSKQPTRWRRHWSWRERVGHPLPTLLDQLLPQIDGVECVLNRFERASCFDKPGLELKHFEFLFGEAARENLLSLKLACTHPYGNTRSGAPLPPVGVDPIMSPLILFRERHWLSRKFEPPHVGCDN